MFSSSEYDYLRDGSAGKQPPREPEGEASTPVYRDARLFLFTAFRFPEKSKDQTMKDLIYLIHLTPSRNLEAISIAGLLVSQSRQPPGRIFFTDPDHIERTVEEVFFTHMTKEISAIGVELFSGSFTKVANGLYVSCLSISTGRLNFLEDCTAEIRSCFV